MPGNNLSPRALALVAAALLTIPACGCRTAARPAASPGAASADAQPPEPSGVEVWAQNCGRCHNMRDPASYSSAQWEVAVHHMRVRAQLTGQQEKAVREFLASK